MYVYVWYVSIPFVKFIIKPVNSYKVQAAVTKLTNPSTGILGAISYHIDQNRALMKPT
jgi:hypothetical protein